MTTTIKYRLLCTTGPDSDYQVGDLFNSEIAAKNHALCIQSREEHEYKIVSIVTTCSTLDVFAVPAYIPTLEEIAADIIDGSDGSYYMEWGEDIKQLSDSDRSKVEEMVWEQITNCDHCGWHFHVEQLEQTLDGENLCWRCAQDAEEDEEEGESDED